MKWLHLSDLHFNPSHDGFSTSLLRNKLKDFISINNIKVDLILLTGDYRHAANNTDSNEQVAKNVVEYIKEISKITGVDIDNIHYIPGNHDLNRFVNESDLERLDSIVKNYTPDNGKLLVEDKKFLFDRFESFAGLRQAFHEIGLVDSFKDNIHPYRCYEDLSILKLNTCLVCNSDDRNNLIVFMDEIYKSLECIKLKNQDKPIIILAHHEIGMLRADEKSVLETLLNDYNIVLFLCGDAHTPWSRKINDILEVTTGCLLYHEEVDPTFEIGGLIDNKLSICMYHWNNDSKQWIEHNQLNSKLCLELDVSNRLIHESMNVFDKQWFLEKNKQQIFNLGSRYSPKINIKLSLSEIFDGVMRNSNFFDRFKNKTDEMLLTLGDVRIKKIISIKQTIIEQFENSNTSPNEKINFEILKSLSEEVLQLVTSELEVIKKSEKDSDNYYLRKAYNALQEYIDYIESKEVYAVNNPFVLLHGEGGIGKSHLIADIIEMNQHQISLLFLGQHFSDCSNPLNDIKRILDLEYMSTSEILSKLNRTAKFGKRRLVIFIDALNEGKGKEIWSNHLAGLVNEIKKYEYLGLVVSVRTEYKSSIFKNNPECMDNFIDVKHTGFFTVEHTAVLKYFDFYNLKYTDIPFGNVEFRNPLFLRMFCFGFRGKIINWSKISISDIYENYLSEINEEITDRLKISKYRNIVAIALKKIVEEKYNANKRNNLFDMSQIIQIFVDLEKEERIDSRLFDEMIATGILTKSFLGNDEYIHLTYEKLEDYLYGKLLVEELLKIGLDEFENKHNDLIYYEDILEAFSIALSEQTKYEIFDVFTKSDSNSLIIAFINALKWRSTESITDNTIELINSKAFNRQYLYELFDVFFILSTREGHLLNANRLVEHLKKYTMADRDALFIPLFDDLYSNEDSSISRIISWVDESKSINSCSRETRYLTSITLSLFLITSNNKLRDNATKAMIKLLSQNVDELIYVMVTVSDIDDPYLLERLYSVAYGCIMAENSNEQIEKLGNYVYKQIFSNEFVYPNILLRDHARNIVKYAQFKCENSQLTDVSVDAPYRSNFPSIPTDEEIQNFELDYKGEKFKDYHWSQNNIISSMRVEYDRSGRSGGYGDFGRYTFQSYFSDWKNMNYNDLMNIAVKKIFDLGYDVEKHGIYDRSVGHGRYNSNAKERIGKKYQWIAFYELAAQVADNYKITIHTDEYGSQKETYCIGSLEPSIRNFDPTISHFDNRRNEIRSMHNKLYDLPNISNKEWIKSLSDEISIPQMIEISYEGDQFVLLNGWYKWKEEKKLGEKNYQNPQKDMWYYINSYIVKKDQIDTLLANLKGENFMGRWLSDPSGSYQLYNKEYYWSDSFDFLNNPYYSSFGWTSIGRHSNVEDLEVIISTYEYRTERDADKLNEDSFPGWHKPCKEIFAGLEMHYGAGDSILYDCSGNIIAFDSLELLNEDVGFFVHKDLLSKYLKNQNYEIIWACLGEKRIIEPFNHTREHIRPSISAVLALGDENEISLKTISQFKE